MSVPEFYILQKQRVPEIATAALMHCQLCRVCISGMGGPGHNVCVQCGDKILSGAYKLTAREAEITIAGAT